MEQEHSGEEATAEPVASQHQASGETQEEVPGPEELRVQIRELTHRADQLMSNWQRTQADLSNYRKQVEQEKEELQLLANAALMMDLLVVLDDLERALESVSEPLRAYTWVGGIGLIQRKLEMIFTAYGVEEIQAQGQPMDPLLHQAVAEVEGEAGKVVSVVQRGYTLGHRLLRPALVVVGRGGGSTPSAETTPEGAPPAASS